MRVGYVAVVGPGDDARIIVGLWGGSAVGGAEPFVARGVAGEGVRFFVARSSRGGRGAGAEAVACGEAEAVRCHDVDRGLLLWRRGARWAGAEAVACG